MSEHSSIQGKTPFQAARTLGAKERQAARDTRDPARQIEVLNTRPGSATKERRRLLKQLADKA